MGNSLDRWWNAIRQQHARSLDRSPENIGDRWAHRCFLHPCWPAQLWCPGLRVSGLCLQHPEEVRGRGRLRREGRGDSDHALQEPQPAPQATVLPPATPLRDVPRPPGHMGNEAMGPLNSPLMSPIFGSSPLRPVCRPPTRLLMDRRSLGAGAPSACPGHGPGRAMLPRLQLLPRASYTAVRVWHSVSPSLGATAGSHGAGRTVGW